MTFSLLIPHTFPFSFLTLLSTFYDIAFITLGVSYNKSLLLFHRLPACFAYIIGRHGCHNIKGLLCTPSAKEIIKHGV